MRRLAFIGLLLLAPVRAPAAAILHWVGDLPGGSDRSGATAISADGHVVVGYSRSGTGSSDFFEGFRWTLSGGIEGLGVLPGQFSSEARGVSADGSVIVGVSGGPVRWAGAGPELLAGSEFSGIAHAVSDDGSIVVGIGVVSGAIRAVRWEAGQPAESLGVLPGASGASEALGISGDGLTIVGSSASPTGFKEPFQWTSANGMSVIDGVVPFTTLAGSARDASLDGSVIVGSDAGRAFRWSNQTGMVDLGVLDPTIDSSHAWGVSADGSIIVGSSGVTDGNGAFIWDAQRGMRRITDVLMDQGIDLGSTQLREARAISGAGDVIVGVGLGPSGFEEGWVLYLPEPGWPSLMLASFLCFGLTRRS